MREGVNKREVDSQSSELLWSQKELKQLKDGILGEEKLSKEKQKPSSITPEELLKKLQSVDKSIFEQPKVLLGSSYYNDISDFGTKQGTISIQNESINKDGTIKFLLKSWGEEMKFDYDPVSKSYYIMPAGKPDKKIIFETELQVAAAAERINFCKYINRSDNANNSAPYESTGSEIRKWTQYLISYMDFILPKKDTKTYIDLFVYYLNRWKDAKWKN